MLQFNCEMWRFCTIEAQRQATANRLVFFSFVATPNVWVSDNLLNYRLSHLTEEIERLEM